MNKAWNTSRFERKLHAWEGMIFVNDYGKDDKGGDDALKYENADYDDREWWWKR